MPSGHRAAVRDVSSVLNSKHGSEEGTAKAVTDSIWFVGNSNSNNGLDSGFRRNDRKIQDEAGKI
jgi:hypothetical protein